MQPAKKAAASEGLAEMTQSLKKKSQKKGAAANTGVGGLEHYLATPGITAKAASQPVAKAGKAKVETAEGTKRSKVKKAKVAC